ncbi:protein cordon-bleu isoform X3 [Loxodonta africana]|uniref:protein cordon-bleu isoform X3 n=1 Tax=Loxodonta africana TaxID=9785 RepID=UPI0030CFD4C2
MDSAPASAAKPPTGRKMKARAPLPPGNPATLNVHGELKPSTDLGPSPQQNLINMKENLRNSMVDITVVLPSGLEKKSVVSGSHAMMDLLVELCLQYHLNPSHHALEIRSLETQQPLSFKPSTLVGTLNVHTVFLKEKVPEDKAKPGASKVPEKSVCLVVNYLRTQKAVVRVSPEVPLQNILPVICAKCEVSPEHVVLLRDNIAGEELELSKSLNELGIKELYAWDNKRETLRKSSLGDDETDKEKKKFLGFFKVNKRSNSKAEQLELLGVDGEDGSESASGRGWNGCLTTPNSPSVNSRSITLGPSLSLSNISGVSVKSEMKKRRAPPPPSLPSTGTPVQDRASEKVSLGSQIDIQKKKRRAPAPPPPQPPPPSPLVPSRTEDREENRKSTMGVGRQVPQKPPRGTARGPPQLVLPPPPPYPPPDSDVAEPLGFPGEGAGQEASDLRPKLSLPLGPSSNCMVDGGPLALSEAEETASVGSCFASEDTTEDSGVMSSPSDIISLDSQHDSVKSKDKWTTDQEDCSDQDLTGTPEMGPQRSPSWERNGSGHLHQRPEKAATASNDDEHLLITGQFQKTHAELDEEEMEESYETDTSSLTNSLNDVSNHLTQDAIITSSNADAIPVTFIGEVLDDPVDLGLFSNRNNNAGSSDTGSIASRRTHLSFQAEDNPPLGKKREVPESYTPSHDSGKNTRLALSNTCNAVNSIKIGPRVTTSASKLHTDDLNAQEKSQVYGWTCSEKTGPATQRGNSQPASEKEGNDKNEVLSPPSWYQRGQNTGGSYGLKYGLTTYKIVPAKSEMRCYDRGASLSTGAIKIDELGNLVGPYMNGSKTIPVSSSVLETEGQPVGKVKEFWRSTSMENRSSVPTECPVKRTSTTLPTNPQNPESRLRAHPTSPGPTLTLPQQQPAPREDGRHLEERRSQSHRAITVQAKGPATTTTEVSFLKPPRRTSSQYVASAIAKRIEAQKPHANLTVKHSDAQRSYEGRAPKPAGRHLATKDNITPNPCSETALRKDDAKQPCFNLSSSNGVESAVGTHPRAEITSSYGKLSAQNCPAGTPKSSFVPLIKPSQRDHVSVGQSCGFSGKQSPRNQKTSSASEPQYVQDSTDAPPSHSADEQASPRALVNGLRWPPVSSEPPHSLKVSTTNSHVSPDTEQKPNTLSTDANETEGTLTSSIFGPKKKFKPVIQRPAPKDTSLHSALMEAIHAAGGKEKLRKTAEHTSERGPKKLFYTEAESERSALLAAIRGHSGACSLKKVSSLASEELQTLRDAELSAHGSQIPQQDSLCVSPPPPPLPPAAPAPPVPRTATASKFSTGTLNNPVDARQALMDAIRSGSGAARLKKVPLLV